ncbi:GNAT family N-acetyltransferase [Marinicella sp. W31]|uniref:GNAT family N-acetyltransferase n=1 Tax=Marinicella sp. W31 TaxID=3023713 RepID=UPI00375820AE
MNSIQIVTGYVPGGIGRIVELHGTNYVADYGFGLYYEAKIASELADFYTRYDSERMLAVLALQEQKVLASIFIDDEGNGLARLRWFICDPMLRGQGIGTRLIDQAMQFCRDKQYKHIYLWTLAGLDAAETLYRRAGFKISEEFIGEQWGPAVTERKMEYQFQK